MSNTLKKDLVMVHMRLRSALTLLHSERLKFNRVIASLSAIGLNYHIQYLIDQVQPIFRIKGSSQTCLFKKVTGNGKSFPYPNSCRGSGG